MIPIYLLRTCFDQFFSKHVLSFCSIIKVISINLINLYSETTKKTTEKAAVVRTAVQREVDKTT